MLLLALAAQAAAAQPRPGELKTFGDWTVGCDNARACRAVALVPDGEDRADYLLLVIDRDGAPAAQPRLSFSTGSPVPQASYVLRVDGRAYGRVTGASLPFGRPLADALGNGSRAAITLTDGRALASASLKGAAAAFLHMDERQRRVGTTGALRRTGPKPDSAVPAPPPPPRVVQPKPSNEPPRLLAPATAEKLIGRENARCDHAQGRVEPRAFRLDARHSLALVEHPCGNGAYNIMTSVFVLDGAGRVAPAPFDIPPGWGDGRDNVLVNADWDPRRRRLTDFSRARGLGDCGATSAFAWDGGRFRLVRSEVMGECRGSTDYITTWRAAVTTR